MIWSHCDECKRLIQSVDAGLVRRWHNHCSLLGGTISFSLDLSPIYIPRYITFSFPLIQHLFPGVQSRKNSLICVYGTTTCGWLIEVRLRLRYLQLDACILRLLSSLYLDRHEGISSSVCFTKDVLMWELQGHDTILQWWYGHFLLQDGVLIVL